MQKIHERTTAVESRVSGIEDRLPPLMSEARSSTSQLAKANNLCNEDFENRLRQNIVRTVGLPERVEGKNPTDFIEQWLLTLFAKEAFTPLFVVQQDNRTHPGLSP